jgi:hypothetical protein
VQLWGLPLHLKTKTNFCLTTILQKEKIQKGVRMKQKNEGETSIGVGVGVGVALGAAIGAALGNVGVGVALGVAIGAALGAALSQMKKEE